MVLGRHRPATLAAVHRSVNKPRLVLAVPIETGPDPGVSEHVVDRSEPVVLFLGHRAGMVATEPRLDRQVVVLLQVVALLFGRRIRVHLVGEVDGDPHPALRFGSGHEVPLLGRLCLEVLVGGPHVRVVGHVRCAFEEASHVVGLFQVDRRVDQVVGQRRQPVFGLPAGDPVGDELGRRVDLAGLEQHVGLQLRRQVGDDAALPVEEVLARLAGMVGDEGVHVERWWWPQGQTVARHPGQRRQGGPLTDRAVVDEPVAVGVDRTPRPELRRVKRAGLRPPRRSNVPATLFVAGKRLVHGRRRRIRQVEILVRAAVGEQVGDRRFQGVEPPGQFLDADLHILVARFAEGGQAGQDKAERFDEPGRRRLGLVVVVRLGFVTVEQFVGHGPQHDGSDPAFDLADAFLDLVQRGLLAGDERIVHLGSFDRCRILGRRIGGCGAGSDRWRREGVPDDPRRLLLRLGDRQQGVRGTLTPHDRRRHGGPRVERQQARPVLGFPGDEHVESGDGRVDGCVHEIGLVGHGGPIMSVGRISGGVAAQRSGHRVDVARLAEVWRQRHRHDVGGHQVVRVGRVTDEHGVVRGDPGV